MDLFSPDREATQRLAEISEQRLRVLPYQEDAQYYQWVFEICTIEPTARQTLSVGALLEAFIPFMKLGDVQNTPAPTLREVDQAEARTILIALLSCDLAYGSATEVPMPQVDAVVEHLFQIFSAHPGYFTNGNFLLHPFRLLSWHPLTIHSFDTGLLLFDDQHIGILWATQED
jgi:hypothetical protein